MFASFFRIALRNVTRNKVYVLINTLGIGVAIACCLSAYLLFAYNLEFDNYYAEEQTHNIVKVLHRYERLNKSPGKDVAAPIVLAPWAARDIAGIEDFSRFCNQEGILNYSDNTFVESIRFADASFFNLFNIGFKAGSSASFQNTNAIILSERLAKKYFGNADPVGQPMRVEFSGKKYDLTVGGVLERIPLNTSFQINALMRIEKFLEVNEVGPADWSSEQLAAVLFQLTDISQIQTVSDQLNRYASLRNEGRTESRTIAFDLVPFLQRIAKTDVNRTNLRLPIQAAPLVIFGSLACFILLIACFNLTNTTLALTGRRLKGIGVRKVVGSTRSQIVNQFLIEIVITIALAIGAGALMALVLVPQFALLWQLDYGLGDINGLNFVYTLITLLVLTALLGGIYPALFSSRINPVALLKGGMSIQGTNPLTRFLLVAQFSMSVIVLLGGVVFTRNAAFQRTISFGYDKDRILTVSIQGEQEFTRFRDLVSGSSLIENMTGAANHIGPYSSSNSTLQIGTEVFKSRVHEVGAHYFDVVGLPRVAGRDFAEGSQADFESALIVDENFVRNHNLVNPIESQITYKDKRFRIIGVVANHLGGLKQEYDNEHVYALTPPTNYYVMVVRSTAGKLIETKAYLETAWKDLNPGKPFEARLQEEILFEEANGYNTNLRLIFFFLTVLGCLLSASGIYALSSLNVQRRRKEIGVRKVLGATVRQVMVLLNKEFSLILGVSMFVGGAGGWFLADALLDDLYKQHIEIDPITIVACGLTIFCIGIFTTSRTIFGVATSNPTESLKSE